MLLKTIEHKPGLKEGSGFPYTLPFVNALSRIDFVSPVTFLVGENGSGKSTFLEAIACAVGSITVGSESVQTDPTLATMRAFAKNLKLSWTKRSKKGFFMRSEDFFGFAKHMAQVRAEMEQEIRNVEEEYKGRSDYAKGLAKMPYMREIGEMQRYYGESLDHNSHGEGFFKLFRSRFVGEGLYLMDEPEAPLSPSRQLSLLSLLKAMVDQGGQFIIATHSPILMAYPGATIWSFDDGDLREVAYDDLEHVTVTRSFLNNPQAYLTHLMGD